MGVLQSPLTNGQLELLKMFSHDLSQEDLIALKRTLTKFFADKASDEMDKLWETNNWSDQTMDSWLADEDRVQAS